jgi:hypothetical protein
MRNILYSCFGTTVKYKIEHPEKNRLIEAVFVTYTAVSDVAREFEKHLVYILVKM